MKTRIFAPAMALIMSTLVLAGGCGRTDAVVEGQAEASVAPGPPAFSKETKAKVEEMGTTVQTLDPNDKRSPISLARALQLAEENFGRVLQHKRAAEAQYGLVTNNRSGTLQADKSRPSNHRWIVNRCGCCITATSRWP